MNLILSVNDLIKELNSKGIKLVSDFQLKNKISWTNLLITFVNLVFQGSTCVHCAAGIGRTGTFITLKIIIDLIDRKGLSVEISVQRIVLMLRSQRPGMVQNETQYKYIYEVLMLYVSMLLHKSNNCDLCNNFGSGWREKLNHEKNRKRWF